MPVGRIVRWNDEKGYGFIRPNDGGRDIFLHISAVTSLGLRPEGNELVRYELTRDPGGRACAADVAFLNSRKPTKRSGRSVFPLVVVVAFGASFAAAVEMKWMPAYMPWFYFVMSLITFGIYVFDKYSAKRGGWRTSESTLLFFGLAGGWPGALLAQNLLRHKSRKTAFLVPFWITVFVNVAALWWLTTPQGIELLGRFGRLLNEMFALFRMSMT